MEGREKHKTDYSTILRARLSEIEAQINDVIERWPAHSVSPKLVAQLEELEEERELIQEQLKSR